MKDQRGQINLQDNFLNKIRKNGDEIKIILVSGDSIKGVIVGFDSFVIILKSDNKDIIIYKHSITAIFPQKDFSLF